MQQLANDALGVGSGKLTVGGELNTAVGVYQLLLVLSLMIPCQA